MFPNLFKALGQMQQADNNASGTFPQPNYSVSGPGPLSQQYSPGASAQNALNDTLASQLTMNNNSMGSLATNASIPQSTTSSNSNTSGTSPYAPTIPTSTSAASLGLPSASSVGATGSTPTIGTGSVNLPSQSSLPQMQTQQNATALASQMSQQLQQAVQGGNTSPYSNYTPPSSGYVTSGDPTGYNSGDITNYPADSVGTNYGQYMPGSSPASGTISGPDNTTLMSGGTDGLYGVGSASNPNIGQNVAGGGMTVPQYTGQGDETQAQLWGWDYSPTGYNA